MKFHAHTHALLQTLICSFLFQISADHAIAAGASTPPRVKQNTTVQQRKNERAEKLFKDGNKLMEFENYEQAARRFSAAVRAWPKFAEAHSNLGYCYRKQKKYDEAIASYLKAIEIKPKLAEAREYLAEAYAELAADYRRKALQELEILKKLDPEEAGEVEKFIQNLDL